MKVLLNEKIHPAAIDLLKKHFEVLIADNTSEEALLDKCTEASAIIVRTTSRITRKIIESAPNLVVISRTGVGVDNVDVQAATERGILVCHLPGINTQSVAEHTVMLMLAVAKDLRVMDTAVRTNRWSMRSSLKPVELEGKTLGIVGLGRIGSRIAEICSKGFGMKILAFDPLSPEIPRDFTVNFVSSLEELFRQADVISIHASYSKETHHLVDYSLLSKAKEGAILVNTARGSIVDEHALVKALQTGPLSAAGLDVFEEEPLDPSHPLLRLDNVIITPHSATLTKETHIRAAVEAAQATIDALTGKPPRWIYNKESLCKLGYTRLLPKK